MARKRRRSTEFILNLLAIIVGVFITLYLTGKIADHKEHKDLQLQLDAVKVELQSNIEAIDDALEHLLHIEELRIYLTNTKFAEIDNSIVLQYHIGYNNPFNYNKNAFEVLKATGGMRLITDKQQLLAIMNCYSKLEVLKDDHKGLMDMQRIVVMDMMKQNIALVEEFNTGQFDIRKYPSVFNYFISDNGIHLDFTRVKKNLEETLQMLQ